MAIMMGTKERRSTPLANPSLEDLVPAALRTWVGLAGPAGRRRGRPMRRLPAPRLPCAMSMAHPPPRFSNGYPHVSHLDGSRVP